MEPFLAKLWRARSRLYRSHIFQANTKLVTRCCAKEERQRGSDEGGKAEKKERRAGEEEESGKRRGGGGEYLSTIVYEKGHTKKSTFFATKNVDFLRK